MKIYASAISHENVSLLTVAAHTSAATVQIGIYRETYSIYGKQTGHKCCQWPLHMYKPFNILQIIIFEYIKVISCVF